MSNLLNPIMYLYSTSSYNSQITPPLGKNSIEYQPSDVDLLRYRLGKVYIGDSGFAYALASNSAIVPNAPSIVYQISKIEQGTKIRIETTQVKFAGVSTTINVTKSVPDEDKQIITIVPKERRPGSTFSTSDLESQTYNGEPTINNWINSITDTIPGVPNPLSVLPSLNTEEYISELTFQNRYAVDDRYKDLISNGGSYNYNGASVEVVYNYYNKSYENVMNYESYVSNSAQQNPFQLEERLLPSYYALSDMIGGSPFTLQDESRNIASLGGALNSLFGFNATNNTFNLKDASYFSEYSRKIFELRNSENLDPILATISNNQKNIILQGSQITDLIQDTDDILANMPMYNKISFDMQPTSARSSINKVFLDLKNTISANNLWSSIIAAVAYHSADFTLPISIDDKNSFNILSPNGVPFMPDNFYEGVSTPEVLGTQRISSILPIIGGFNSNATVTLNSILEDANLFIPGNINRETRIFEFDPTYIATSGIISNLQNSLDQLKTIRRDYQGIVLGNPAQSDILCYKVEKWSVDAGNNPQELIQSFYVPNTGNINRANIFDTQIKYGKKYIYRIYAFNLVVGTKYKYSLDNITQPNEYNNSTTKELSAEICVFLESDLRVVRTPYYQKLIHVSDKPPISPDVEVYPYFGDKNKIKFLLKSNIGTSMETPIIIRPEDSIIFEDIRKSFNLGPSEMITFKSDDPSIKFEVFKLDRRPTSYEDFKFGEYKQFETTGFENPYKKAASAALEDFLEPNKKYYYTFRAVDVHGKISNPSPIYQLEISYDGASPFLITNIVSLIPEKVPAQSATKKLKKYLRIRPNFQQTLLNEEATGIIDQNNQFNNNWFNELENEQQNPEKKIILGDEESPLWGKTFKIRLTSKKSGKKIDLNVNFKTNKVIIDEKDVNNIS